MQQQPATSATLSATTVTVVSRKGCVQCNATYRTLNKLSIEHTIDLDEASADHALALTLGHQQAPVVLVRDASGALLGHWSGFQPARIDELAVSLAGSGELIPA